MNYTIKELSINSLYELIKDGKLDLRPPYQRNFIWSRKDQQLLIDSIEKGYPLPSFFLYKKPDGIFEMVDGQQRAESICRFLRGDITDKNKQYFSNINQDKFLSYILNITEISSVDESSGESISTFYALVNKQGQHLNSAEIYKAQYSDSSFLSLVEDLLETDEISILDIFTNKTKARMNDRTLIEELIAYLAVGFFDKRDAVDELYQKSFSIEDSENYREQFMNIIKRIVKLNSIKPINTTRYRQRNDFFTLFSFIHKNNSIISDDLLNYQYNLLLWVDNNNMIRPSNEDLELMQNYAFACVTQSNSKKSRETRFNIMELLLLHRQDNYDENYEKFIEDLKDYFNCEDIPHIQMGEYWLIDINNLNYGNEE